MKAAVLVAPHRFEIQERPVPEIGAADVLVKVERVGICGTDLHIFHGHYAADRLPLERLRRGTPAFLAGEDSYTNHIHAGDLGAACVAALARGAPNRVYNACDDSDLPMGAWFDKLADAYGLPRPPRIARAEAQSRLSPMLLSFMNESRRLGNRRLKAELRLRLRFPTVDAGIADAVATTGREPPCSG